MIRFDILTLFPDMFKGLVEDSIIKRAIEKKLIEVNLIDFREFSTNKHHILSMLMFVFPFIYNVCLKYTYKRTLYSLFDN